MSYYLRGSAASHDSVTMLAGSLPTHLQGVAAASLRQLARTPGVRLMPPAVNVVRDAEARVVERLQSNPVVQFYVGISERPQYRFLEHQRNGFNLLWLYVFASSAASGSAERALIQKCRRFSQCLNVGDGNERASQGQPHYLYIVWMPHSIMQRR